MQCLKCGKEIPEGQAFCDACLEIMAQHPVKPGTPVQILPRKSNEKTPRKRELSPEELLVKQRRKTRHLRRIVLILALLLACSIGALLYLILPQLKGLPIPPM